MRESFAVGERIRGRPNWPPCRPIGRSPLRSSPSNSSWSRRTSKWRSSEYEASSRASSVRRRRAHGKNCDRTHLSPLGQRRRGPRRGTQGQGRLAPRPCRSCARLGHRVRGRQHATRSATPWTASTSRRPERRTGAALCAAPPAPLHSSRTEMRRERPRLSRANPAPGRATGSLTPHVSLSILEAALATGDPKSCQRSAAERATTSRRAGPLRAAWDAPICPARKRPFPAGNADAPNGILQERSRASRLPSVPSALCGLDPRHALPMISAFIGALAGPRHFSSRRISWAVGSRSGPVARSADTPRNLCTAEGPTQAPRMTP